MDSTPLSHQSEPRSRTKSSSRLSKIRRLAEENELNIPQLSLDIVPSSPKIASPSPSLTISPRPPYTRPLHELLLLSPSPLRRSKTRLGDRLDMADDAAELNGGRSRRCKTRNAGLGVSPRNSRRSRRRLEQDVREEKDLGLPEEMIIKPRKKRNSGRSKKDKHSLPSSSQSPKTIDEEGCNLDRIGQMINDLIMWKDVSKSSLWFGFGSICFLSSCFARGINFSIFSMISQLGLLFLVVSFFSNSVRQREALPKSKREFKLKEDDIFRVGKVILPAANLAISTIAKLFSGEPAMTLKVVPFLILGAEYGHFITLWRLCALGFFFSFTGPKLYSSYSVQISKKAERLKSWVLETWGACSHKKVVAASAVTAFWNLTSIRTRILAAFVCLVVLKCCRQQHTEIKIEDETAEGEQEQKKVEEETAEGEKDQQALVLVEVEESQK